MVKYEHDCKDSQMGTCWTGISTRFVKQRSLQKEPVKTNISMERPCQKDNWKRNRYKPAKGRDDEIHSPSEYTYISAKEIRETKSNVFKYICNIVHI